MKPRIIGHRGMGPSIDVDCTHTENTAASIEEAYKLGADGVEMDAAVTKDGVVVLLHDDELNLLVDGADRQSRNLGMVYDYTFDELKQFTVGSCPISSLDEILEITHRYNGPYRERTGRNLTLNIELKGKNVIEPVYETIMRHVKEGRFDKKDFVFNTFKWDRLKQLKKIDPEMQVVPNIKSVDLFGEKNVQMPGYRVRRGATYTTEGMQRLRNFHESVGCHAFDCVIYDIQPPLFELAKELGIGVYASPSTERTTQASMGPLVKKFVKMAEGLPVSYIKADNVAEISPLVHSKRVVGQENSRILKTDESLGVYP